MQTQVGVIAKFSPEGDILPMKVLWEDGRGFGIDKILDARPAASLKSGGCGQRYTCRIMNRLYYLFLEETHWFIERA